MKKINLILSTALVTALIVTSCNKKEIPDLDTEITSIISNPGQGVTFDGYSYKSIVLGNGQEWMAENLRTSKFCNGDPIPNWTADALPEETDVYWVHYDNNSQYENPYGKLYNWYTVDDSRNICPCGWHVPTVSEWLELTNYLKRYGNAGDQMKSTGTQYWEGSNTHANNKSGFSALPGGSSINPSFFANIGTHGHWWSSSEDGSDPWSINLVNYWGIEMINSVYSKTWGFSVRCLKN